jgi:7,8-dihydro-6-hydroxymethylpterin-pyrophosphokinase
MKQQPEHNFTAYLLIGGNIGERKSNLQTAAQKLKSFVAILFKHHLFTKLQLGALQINPIFTIKY